MTTSYNGWPASKDRAVIGVEPFTVYGRSFPGGVKTGPVAVVFTYLLTNFHRRVEALTVGWCWGYSYRKNRNSSNLSCHASGTAVDANAPRHPNGKAGTFTPAQVAEIRKLLADLDGVVRWGGDFTGTPDEMHFEIHGTPVEVAAVAARLTAPRPTLEDDMAVICREQGKPTVFLTDLLTAKRSLDSAAEVAALKAVGVRDVGEIPAQLLADVPTVAG